MGRWHEYGEHPEPPCPPPHAPPPHWRPHHPGLPVKGLLWIAVLKTIKEQGQIHGAEIQKRLAEMIGEEIPRPVVYKLLRVLEHRGLIVSTWDTSGSGPARRLYKITEEGEEALKAATQHLAKLKSTLDKLL